MADGISPSNEGRGYVLRRIMRRAMRHAHILGSKEPLMHRLVPTLINEMGDTFNELNRAKLSIESTFLQEEERFLKTLGRGTTLLNSAIAGLSRGDILNGEMAFKLYDTYGFPVDLTEDALRTKGISVDIEGFDKAMLRQKESSKVAGFKSGDADMDNVWFEIKDKFGPTEFIGYETLETDSVVDCILVNGAVANNASDCDIMFITNKSPFYAESGGQAGDIGMATLKNGTIEVSNVIKKAGDLHVVIGYLDGSMKCGDKINLCVDAVNRKQTTINHSAAHLMHEALRRTLGEHVTQKGQMVDGNKIRFDISHGKAISNEELIAVEKEVNDIILQNSASTIETMNPDEAIAKGAMALFGEKYGDSVRVLSIGNNGGEKIGKYSVELCGGTHVEFTGDIALFKILSESAVAAGIRRLEAVTGNAAREYLENQAGYAVSVAKKLKSKPELIEDRITTLINERNSLEKELIKVKKALALGGDGKESITTESINGVNFLSAVLNGMSGKDLRSLVNEKIASIDTGIVCFIGTDHEKVTLIVAVTKDLAETYNAVELVNAGAEIVGGRGGGKPTMAQAGGSQASKAADALNAIRNKI
jgi:alanyl-tRNA synthetase